VALTVARFSPLLFMLAHSCVLAEGVLLCAAVSGAQPGQGNIAANLFSSETAYMREPAASDNKPVDASGGATLCFGRFEPGEYAIVVVHDANANGKLDSNFFRIPKEKIGFSNNTRGRFGPAKWEAAKFSLADADLTVEIFVSAAKKEK